MDNRVTDAAIKCKNGPEKLCEGKRSYFNFPELEAFQPILQAFIRVVDESGLPNTTDTDLPWIVFRFAADRAHGSYFPGDILQCVLP